MIKFEKLERWGGFGGCTINLVEKSFKDEFIERVYKA